MSADRKTFLPLWAFPAVALLVMAVALFLDRQSAADTALGTAIATAFVAALYTFVPNRTRRQKDRVGELNSDGDTDGIRPCAASPLLSTEEQTEQVEALLRERLDYWLPGGKGLRSEVLPVLASEIVGVWTEEDHQREVAARRGR